MAIRCTAGDVLRTAAVFCCLAVLTATNQGIYRSCADGKSVAVPCLRPSPDCAGQPPVPGPAGASCMRWHSCCKEPPSDIEYLPSAEEKVAHREQVYQRAVSWLVSGAKALKSVWNSILTRVRGGSGSSGEQSPTEKPIPPPGPGDGAPSWPIPPPGPGDGAPSWPLQAYTGNRPSRPNDRIADVQQPSSLYGPPKREKAPNSDWLTHVKGLSSEPSAGDKLGGEQGPFWFQSGITAAPQDQGFSPQTATPSRLQPSGSSLPGRLLPPPTAAATEKALVGAPAPLDGADAIVAEAARRWLPADCGRPDLSASSTPVGRRRRRRRDITGGHPAERSRWQWMALVGMRQAGENWAENRGVGPIWFCGGVVVTRSFVLTAGHCVSGRALDKLVVRLGEYNLSSTTDGAHQDRLVRSITLHPQFVSRQNDVALLRLSDPVELGGLVRPVCLPVPGAPPALPGPRRVAGWGRLSFAGAEAAVLQEAKLDLVATDDCEAVYRRLSTFDKSFPGGGFLGTKLCAVDPSSGGADACQGDSGGPLTEPRSDGRFALAGIVSLGVGCGDPGFPGVYTRVEKYVPWIVAVIATAEAEAALPGR